MKKIFLIGLIAVCMGCTEEKKSPENPSKDLQISLSLGNISTRAIDESIIDNDGKGYVLPFTEIKTLKVELYKSLDENPILAYTATYEEIDEIRNTPTGNLAKLSIPKIPITTQYVKVIINRFNDANPSINHLQVINQDTPPAPVMSRTEVPYEGTSTAIVIPEESTLDFIKVKAKVEVSPVLSRFEIKPGKIKIVDPVNDDYIFDWTDGLEGKAKIKGFTDIEINEAEMSARENFKQKYQKEISGSATYSYRVRLIRSSFPTSFDINTASIEFYINYFKQLLNATAIVKNTNDGVSDWHSDSQYIKDGQCSNMYDTRVNDLTKVNAFHLFPQSVATDATLQAAKDGMPHIIAGFYYTEKQDLPSAPIITTARPDRWLTIRAFKDKNNGEVIRAFKPGYCYSLSLEDVILTPWSLGLEVRVTDDGKVAGSDPVIKDFDQTSHVPEPEGLDLILGLKVSKWRDKDIEVEL